MNKETNVCNVCKSEYFAHTSKITTLCPDCAHQLHEHPRCFHKFENGRCIKCYWNGKTSDYILEIKKRITKKRKSANLNILLGTLIVSIGVLFLLFGLLSSGISYFGVFGVLVGGRFLIQAKKHKKQLEEGI